MISTSIKLDGEQEFKKQLGDVNSKLRTLRSDLQLTTAEFKGQANSLEALEAKDRVLNDMKEQQIEKINALEEALKQVGEVYKDQPKKIDEYQRSLNTAKAELLRLNDELKDNARYMDEARKSADHTADSIDEFGKAVDKADGSSGGGGLKGLVDSLGALKGMIAGGVVVAGVKELAGGIIEIVDATEEYRKAMGTLEESGRRAGYTAEETAEVFGLLHSVMGDTQAATEAAAQLQALGLSQKDLMELTYQTIGAWTALGRAAPIESIAEHTMQTVNAASATGTFSDILVNCGLSEEYFNEQMEQCNTQTERANLVMATLAKEGMAELGQGWMELNDDIVRTNETQAEYEAAQARLAEVLLPAKLWLTELATEGWGVLTDSILTAMDAFREAEQLFAKESALRKDGFFVSHEDRMAAYGYESYYNEDGLLRYRQVEDSIAASDVSEGRPASAQDVYNAAAAGYASAGETRRGGNITTVIQVDGREIARTTQPYLEELNKSNPEVVSDPL